MLLSSTVLAVLAAAPLQVDQQAPTAEPPSLAELDAAVQSLVDASGYSFERTTRDVGGGGGGGGGELGGAEFGFGGPRGGAPSDPVVGRFTKQTPLCLRQGDTEAWRQGDAMVWRRDDGAWQAFAEPAPGSGGSGGSGGRRGGGRGGRRDAGERDEGGDDAGRSEFRSQRALAALRAEAPPHEFLQALDANVSDVTRADEGGRSIYSGKLTAAGAAALGGGLGGMRRRGGDGGGAVQVTGTFRIAVSDGQAERLSFQTVTSGSFGDRKFERKRQGEILFSAIGETEVLVPADVVAALAAEPASAPVAEPATDRPAAPEADGAPPTDGEH